MENKNIFKLLLIFILAFIFIAVISFLIIKNYNKQTDSTTNNQTLETDFVKGEIIVSFKPNTSKEDIVSILKKYNLKSEDKEELLPLQNIGVYKVYVPKGKENYYIDQLKQDIIVETANLNNKVGTN